MFFLDNIVEKVLSTQRCLSQPIWFIVLYIRSQNVENKTQKWNQVHLLQAVLAE